MGTIHIPINKWVDKQTLEFKNIMEHYSAIKVMNYLVMQKYD